MTSESPHNCETCPKYSERPHPCYEGNTIAFCGGERTQIETKAITRKHGCLFHPLAREWLNRDVIKTLVSRQNEESDNYRSAQPYGSKMEAMGKNLGLTEAIELLKGDKK